NAIGAWLGGIVITAGLGYRAPAWVGVGLFLVGLIVISVAIFLRRGGAPNPSSRSVVESWVSSCRARAAGSQPPRTTGLHQRPLPRQRRSVETTVHALCVRLSCDSYL